MSEVQLAEPVRSDKEDNAIWESVAATARAAANKVIVIPKVVEKIAQVYRDKAGPNANWKEIVLEDFSSSSISDLVKGFTGMKQSRVDSSAKLFGKIMGMPMDTNPAYVLSKMELFDGGEGEIPLLLDRSRTPDGKEEREEQSSTIHHFVVGFVVTLLMKMGEGASVERGEDEESLRSNNSMFSKVSEVSDEEAYAAIKKRLDIALASAKKEQKGNGNISSKVKVASSKSRNKEDSDHLLAKLTEISEQLRNLKAENEQLKSELRNSKLKELKGGAAGIESQFSKEKEGKCRSSGLKMGGGGRYMEHYSDDSVGGGEDDDEDGEAWLEKLTLPGEEFHRSNGRREEQSTHNSKIVSASAGGANLGRLCEAALRGDIPSLSRMVQNLIARGLQFLDVQGNLWLWVRKASKKTTDPYKKQYSQVLVSTRWQSVEEVEGDEMIIAIRGMPQSWPEMKVWFEGQINISERDQLESRGRVIAEGPYDPQRRMSNIKKLFGTVKEIVKPLLGLGEKPSNNSNKHVQIFAVVAQFVYLVWNRAIGTNEDSYLANDVKNIWVRYFDAKLISIHGKIDVPMKEAAVLLGYGCKDKCRTGGMCNNFCFHCDKEEVTKRIRGSTTKSQGSNARFQAWKKATLAKNPTAVVGFPQFKKESPAPQKEVVKDNNPITEKEYYEFLEEHQELYEIPIPEDFLAW